MAKKLKTTGNKLIHFYLVVTSSIAFYPTLIALGLFIVSFITLYWDQHTTGSVFGIPLSIKNIINPDSARSLLGTIAGGIISLMVFSFSMVMIILNQTSSIFSPRLLPGLVSQRSNQVVLGFYLGTIAYTFSILSSIESNVYQFQVPSVSIVLNAAFALVCLGLFISFIHATSQTIQIGHLIMKIYRDTKNALDREIEKVHIPDHQLPDMAHWTPMPSPIASYLYSIEQKKLLRIAKELNVCIRLKVPVGMFVNKNDIVYLCNHTLTQAQHKHIFDTFVFHHQERAGQNYVHGFKQLSEITIKALSPGINDPGTAVQALNQLTDLFNHRIAMYGYCIATDENHDLRLIYEPVAMETLFYLSFSSIKNYATADIPVMHTLFLMIASLVRNDTAQQHTDTWLKAVNDLIESYGPTLHTHSDKSSLTKMTQNIIQHFPEHPESALAMEKLAALSS